MSLKSPGSVPLVASPPLMLPQTQFKGLPIWDLSRPFTWEYAAISALSRPLVPDNKLASSAPVGGTSKKLSSQAYTSRIADITDHTNLFLNIFFISSFH